MQHSSIELRVVTLLADKAAPHLISERGVCAVAFDLDGGDIHNGPAINHLDSNDAIEFTNFLIHEALNMLQLDAPSSGVLFIQAESKNLLSAFYMPDAKLMPASSGTLH